MTIAETAARPTNFSRSLQERVESDCIVWPKRERNLIAPKCRKANNAPESPPSNDYRTVADTKEVSPQHRQATKNNKRGGIE